MKKILVSDMLGTLLPNDILEFEYYYSMGQNLRSFDEIHKDKKYLEKLLDRTLMHAAISLEPFLKEGNYLYLVTGENGHEGHDVSLSIFINRLRRFTKKYKDQITICLSDVFWSEQVLKNKPGITETEEDRKNNAAFYAEYVTSKQGVPSEYKSVNKRALRAISSVATIIEEDGITYAQCPDGTRAILIGDKEEVYDIIKRSHDLNAHALCAIGNSEGDLQMLLECMRLGGQSSLIDNHFYRDDESFDDVLFKIALHNTHLDVDKFYPGYSDLSPEKKIELKLDDEFLSLESNWLCAQGQRLYEQLHKGTINIDDLKKLYVTSTIIQNNNFFAQVRPFRYKPIPLDDQMLKRIGVYPTFQDYAKRVLVRKF